VKVQHLIFILLFVRTGSYRLLLPLQWIVLGLSSHSEILLPFPILQVIVFSVMRMNESLTVIVGAFRSVDTNEGRVGALGNTPAFGNSLIKLIEIYHRYNVDSLRVYNH
jgi:hypothetical protein